MCFSLGIEQFKCLKCGYTRRRTDVQKHINKKHLEKTLMCNICKSILNSGSDLLEHMKLKHPDMLLSCDLCTYQTSHETSLIYHKATVHQSNQTICQTEKPNQVDEDVPNVIEANTWRSYYTIVQKDGKRHFFVYIVII